MAGQSKATIITSGVPVRQAPGRKGVERVSFTNRRVTVSRHVVARLLALLLPLLPMRLAAQDSIPLYVGAEVFAGGELEEYLRYMQLAGDVETYPWSVRAFSPGEVARLAPADGTHAWSARFRF